jgi:hypothetical protein
MSWNQSLAEGEGFEPPVPFQAQRFSRPPVSTAHPSLRTGGPTLWRTVCGELFLIPPHLWLPELRGCSMAACRTGRPRPASRVEAFLMIYELRISACLPCSRRRGDGTDETLRRMSLDQGCGATCPAVPGSADSHSRPSLKGVRLGRNRRIVWRGFARRVPC